MNELIALLLPSLICVKQLEKIYGEEQKLKRIIERYLKSVLFVNLVSYLIVIFVFKQTEFIFTNQFTVIYIILSIVIAYILPIIKKVFQDNFNVEIKVEKNEKEN